MTPTTRGFALFVLAASGAVLGTALVSQYWGGLEPCELCLLERWPWDAALAIALVVLLAPSRAAHAGAALPWVALLLAAVFAVSTAFAFYHVGVEQKWFAGPSACTASAGGAMTLEQLKQQILATAPVMCDQVQWSLFGISLAGFNLLASLGMMAICGLVFARARRPSARREAAA